MGKHTPETEELIAALKEVEQIIDGPISNLLVDIDCTEGKAQAAANGAYEILRIINNAIEKVR